MKCSAVGAVLLTAFVLLCHTNRAFALDKEDLEGKNESALTAKADGSYALDDMVVSVSRLKGVTYESDGTLTVTSSNLYTIFKALDSELGAGVNFNVSFASNSTVMNADGQHQLDKLAKALKYMDEGSNFELLVYKGSSLPDSSYRNGLEESRVQEILSKLRRRYKLKHSISVRYIESKKRLKASESKKKASQALAMTIVNLGQSK